MWAVDIYRAMLDRNNPIFPNARCSTLMMIILLEENETIFVMACCYLFDSSQRKFLMLESGRFQGPNLISCFWPELLIGLLSRRFFCHYAVKTGNTILELIKHKSCLGNLKTGGYYEHNCYFYN